MHDPEHKAHSFALEDVEHDAEIADSQPMKRVARTLDRLDRLAAYPAGSSDVCGELREGLAQSRAVVRRKLRERSSRRR